MSENGNGSGSITKKYPDKRKPIKISSEAYEMVKHYADICETSITKSIDEAIKEYYQIVWLTRIEQRTGKSLRLC